MLLNVVIIDYLW